MNTGPGGLPEWVLLKLATGVLPEVSACLATVQWERGDTPGAEAYVFHVGGEEYTVGRFV